MNWSAPLQRQAVPQFESWKTNERIEREWHDYLKGRGAKNTRRNLRLYVGAFIRMFHDPVTHLSKADIEAFVQRIGQKCVHLMQSGKPTCRACQDIERCPLLRDDSDPHACPRYQSLDVMGVWSYITSVNRFYNWLIMEQQVATNPCYPVMKNYQERYRQVFNERKRKPRRRALNKQEVVGLVTKAPMQRGTAYLLMAKLALREHEVLKLSWNPRWGDYREGFLEIPADPRDERTQELGAKRLGNPLLVVDAELQQWLRRYRVWWEEKVARDDDGTPVTDIILISNRGKPWGRGALRNLNQALQTDAVRLGYMTGEETEREERISTHCFRAFGTTWARENGCPDADIKILRGDLGDEVLGRYDQYKARLQRLYDQYMPRLGV